MMTFNDIKVVNLSTVASDLASAAGAGMKSVVHAKVIDFQGGSALLEVDGKRITAQSEVPLKINGEFDLMVKNVDAGGRTQLQIIGANETGGSALRPLSDEMIASRLVAFDLPDHPEAPMMARALISDGAAVTKENMESMINTLPSGAPYQSINFAASLIKEGLPLSRAIVNLLPAIAGELDSLAMNMKAAAEEALAAAQSNSAGNASNQSSDQTAAAQSNSAVSAASLSSADKADLRNLTPAGLMTPPDAANVSDLMEKLPIFVKTFLQSTEAGMNAVVDMNITQSPDTAARSEFMNQAVAVLKAATEQPSSLSAAVQLENEISKIAAEMEHSPPSQSESLNAARAAFVSALKEAMTLPSSTERLGASEKAALNALAASLEEPAPESAAQAPSSPAASGAQSPSASAYPSLYDPALAELPRDAAELSNAVNSFARLIENPAASASEVKSELTNIMSKLAALEQFNLANDSAGSVTGKFIGDAKAWAADTAKIISDAESAQSPYPASAAAAAGKTSQTSSGGKSSGGADPSDAARQTAQQKDDASALARRIALDSENSKLLERVQLSARDPRLREEIDMLRRNFGDTPDLRLALARMAANPDAPSDAAKQLSQNLQYAQLANLAGNTGTERTDAFVTFFPIKIGDKVEIGKLKIYRNTNEKKDGSKSLKPIDPFNAKLVLFLNTEFLGPSMASFQTFKDRSVNCDIEVTDARRKRILDQHLDELKEGISRTSYDNSQVTVKVAKRVRRGGAASGADAEGDQTPSIISVDMRI